jgi:mRNA-degrading endonuclease RelE of RelBE toxin-antitoxin system
MNFEIESVRTFDKQAKRLSKKYPSIKADLVKFAKSLLDNPNQGKSLGKIVPR